MFEIFFPDTTELSLGRRVGGMHIPYLNGSDMTQF